MPRDSREYAPGAFDATPHARGAAQQDPPEEQEAEWEEVDYSNYQQLSGSEAAQYPEEGADYAEERWAAVGDDLDYELPFFGEGSSDEEDDEYYFIRTRHVDVHVCSWISAHVEQACMWRNTCMSAGIWIEFDGAPCRPAPGGDIYQVCS